MTGVPLTITVSMPVGNCWGSRNVAVSTMAAGSKMTMSAALPGSRVPRPREAEGIGDEASAAVDGRFERHDAALTDVVAEEPRIAAVVAWMRVAAAARAVRIDGQAVGANQRFGVTEHREQIVLGAAERDHIDQAFLGGDQVERHRVWLRIALRGDLRDAFADDARVAAGADPADENFIPLLHERGLPLGADAVAIDVDRGGVAPSRCVPPSCTQPGNNCDRLALPARYG